MHLRAFDSITVDEICLLGFLTKPMLAKKIGVKIETLHHYLQASCISNSFIVKINRGLELEKRFAQNRYGHIPVNLRTQEGLKCALENIMLEEQLTKADLVRILGVTAGILYPCISGNKNLGVGALKSLAVAITSYTTISAEIS